MRSQSSAGRLPGQDACPPPAHEEGVSPAWPVSYETLEPFYAEARADLRRAGAAGIDPTEPPRGPHPHAAIPHEPRIARLAEAFARAGLRPAPMPAAVDFGPGCACVRRGTCDAFACVRDAKGNAETRLLRPLPWPAQRRGDDRGAGAAADRRAGRPDRCGGGAARGRGPAGGGEAPWAE